MMNSKAFKKPMQPCFLTITTYLTRILVFVFHEKYEKKDDGGRVMNDYMGEIAGDFKKKRE
jgi:hypothetical protein